MSPELAQQIIEENRALYDRIANHFVQTRHKLWPDGLRIADFISEKSRVLDVGCGSGRLFPLLREKKCDFFGIDNSERIIMAARNQYALQGAKFVVGSLTNIPCTDAYFDVVAILASLHHIPSQELRQTALRECFRVLKPGGVFVATVWNLEAEYFKTKFNLTNDSFIHPEKGLDLGDIFIPWKNDKGEFLGNRFVHSFAMDELARLITSAGLSISIMEYIKNGVVAHKQTGSNIIIVASK